MKLNRRYIRSIRENRSFYISSTVLTVVTLLLYFLFNIAGNAILNFSVDFYERNKIEDAHFTTYMEIPKEKLSELEDTYDVTLEEQRMIGTLSALGYKKGRLMLHYAGFAAIPGVVGGILTAVISMAAAQPLSEMGLQDYEPMRVTGRLNPFDAVLGVFLGCFIMLLGQGFFDSIDHMGNTADSNPYLNFKDKDAWRAGNNAADIVRTRRIFKKEKCKIQGR